jgi:hypothetical protein
MAFEDINVEEFEPALDEGAEEQEAAEPVEPEEQGAEDQEFAEPESEEPSEDGKSAADAAWANMRRRAEEAERLAAEREAELESLRAKQDAREAALANMDVDDIDAIAEQTGMTRDEVLAAIEREEAAAEAEIRDREKDLQIQELQSRIDEAEAEKAMAEDLAKLQKIDPKLTSLEELGDDFAAYISAGLTAEQAFYAIRRKELSTKATPAKPPGRITESTPPEKDYYTEDEVANMTSEEKSANWEKIMASLPRWKK